MKTVLWIFALAVGARSLAYSAGHAEWSGYPVKDSIYKFEIYTGKTDQWDSAEKDTPPLSPGKASQAAQKFVRSVPLREDMKSWTLQTITLQRMAPAPEEWVYIVRFSASPKSSDWNGPLPWMDVPVRFDGTIPKPTIAK
jgi:hypothetical protein